MRRISALHSAFFAHVHFVILGQCKENIVLGHRERGLMRSLISPLQGIINALFNGQLDPAKMLARLELLASPPFKFRAVSVW